MEIVQLPWFFSLGELNTIVAGKVGNTRTVIGTMLTDPTFDATQIAAAVTGLGELEDLKNILTVASADSTSDYVVSIHLEKTAKVV